MTKAAMIVDFVLDYVEGAGAFTGRGKHRRLLLRGGSVNMRTGKITEHISVLRHDVHALMLGHATYRKKTLARSA